MKGALRDQGLVAAPRRCVPSEPQGCRGGKGCCRQLAAPRVFSITAQTCCSRCSAWKPPSRSCGCPPALVGFTEPWNLPLEETAGTLPGQGKSPVPGRIRARATDTAPVVTEPSAKKPHLQL